MFFAVKSFRLQKKRKNIFPNAISRFERQAAAQKREKIGDSYE
jgi:hypothetical protein